MSGGRLCTLLGELGYEGWEALDPDSFEWPFQYEDTRPLLNWICSNLRTSNVLSLSELSQYEQFKQEGKLLEGEDLDFAYHSISAFSERRDNQEAVFGAEEGVKDIKEGTLVYREEALALQRQLSHLQSQFDMLSGQGSALTQGRRPRLAATSIVKGHLSNIDDSLSVRNLQMKAVLERIASTAHELAHYHSGDEDGIYLAYSDFNQFLLGDSSCLKELNQWFAKQLDTGPFRLVAEEGKSKCSWVNLDEISNTYVRADLEKSHHQRVSELRRLRSIFGVSEKQWVEAQVKNAKQQAILMTLKSQVSSDEAHIHLDLHSLRRKHSELKGELSNLYNHEEKLLSETISDLCWELAQLQDTYILQGDYDLKVMRQEYYINRQKAFINHLINLLARHQFLKIACQLEKKNMLGAFSLLKVIESELQAYLSATEGRVGHCLALIQAASDVQEQGGVHDSDHFLHAIRDLLKIYSNTQVSLSTYVSAPGIVKQISALHSDLMSLQSDLENSLPEDRNRCINELCNLIQSLQQLLFASSTTAQPILTPRPLMKELDEMEKINAKLSAAVEEVTHEHVKKNEIVKHHSQEIGLQRRVFVDFFCNPERLRSQVRELTARVRALQIS
ncbi:AUGMIN subunit 3 isoform X1 [Vigna unguiculata]|uniref:AUGMIN subunit 3 isoform X1 n=1 Tax=Vigna unguiculata TaxID=3917 RepID=UPI00101640EE|nr:AUGMIN subunit 3 isoform X1 [Vigna unguiculata]XP_027913735.1 AUGMIN subunit 3 isoform X1 [Vigna unguiculata]XP_027913736.1 AUGMIN subunit 3 isoform X1 [Vigna unguiculata]